MTYNDQQYQQVMQGEPQNYTFLALRLETNEIIKQAELFLSGKRTKVKYDPQSQSYIEDTIEVGTPLANQEGINAILHILSLRINPHTIQGNYKEERYDDFIERTRKELCVEVISNKFAWELRDTELIIDTIMGFIETVMSRIIDNKEREALSTQFHYQTHSRETFSEDKKGGVDGFLRGFKQ